MKGNRGREEAALREAGAAAQTSQRSGYRRRRGGEGRGEAGLTWRGGRQGARTSAAAAPPGLRATEPPRTAPPRSGSGHGGRRPGSSVPGLGTPAPPRAPAAAGTASTPAASPSLRRAVPIS